MLRMISRVLIVGGATALLAACATNMAELVPPQGGTPEIAGDARLAEAVRSGWLRPPVLPLARTPPRHPVAPGAEIRNELDRDRAER